MIHQNNRIVLLIIPNLSFGGAQRSFSKLSVELSKYYTVVNVVFNKDGIVDFPLGGELFDLGVARSTWLGGKLINFWKRVYRLSNLKRRTSVYASISFLEGADYSNFLSHRGEKLIFSVRGSKKYDQNIHGLQGFIRHNILIPFVYKKANLVVAVNMGVADELVNIYRLKNPVEVIYNFYNFDRIKQEGLENISAEFEEIRKRSKIICLVGRLEIEKGLDRFLPVFRRILNQVSVKLLIIGDGNLKQSLIEQSHNLNLITSEEIDQHADVLFVGYQSNPYKYISKCDVLALPSTHEGFPNVLLEAMILGVPVASADCPYGPLEILKTNNIDIAGLLLPVLNSIESEKTWEESLLKLFTDSHLKLALSKKGYLRAITFSESNAISKWLKLIE